MAKLTDEELLQLGKDVAKQQLDDDVERHIGAKISDKAQLNASVGRYEQVICECINNEVTDALNENITFKETIDTFTTQTEIDNYMASVARLELTGCR